MITVAFGFLAVVLGSGAVHFTTPEELVLTGAVFLSSAFLAATVWEGLNSLGNTVFANLPTTTSDKAKTARDQGQSAALWSKRLFIAGVIALLGAVLVLAVIVAE